MTREYKITISLFLGLFLVINIFFALQIDSKIEDEPSLQVRQKQSDKKIIKSKVAALLPLAKPRTPQHKNELSHQELINFAIDNKSCLVLKNMDLIKTQIGASILNHSYSSVLSNSEGDDLLRDVFDSKFIQGQPITKPSTKQGEFLNALLLAGFLNTNNIEPIRYDYNRALEILEDIELTDGDNALVSLYKAALLKKMNAKDSDIREAIIQSLYKKKISSPFFELKQAMYEKGFSNSAFYLLSQILSQDIPSLNLTPIHSSLIEFSKSLSGIDNNLHHELLSLGQRFMRNYAESKQSLHLKAWLENQYNFGTKVFLAAWKKLYPEFNEPFYDSESFRKMARGPHTVSVAEFEKLLLHPDCDLTDISDRIEKEKQTYSENFNN